MIGALELVVLLTAIALLLIFGPRKIPEFARGIGQAWGEFRRARTEMEREIKDASTDLREPL